MYICLLNDKKKCSKCLVLGLGARRNHSVIESYTAWILFYVLSRLNEAKIKYFCLLGKLTNIFLILKNKRYKHLFEFIAMSKNYFKGINAKIDI